VPKYEIWEEEKMSDTITKIKQVIAEALNQDVENLTEAASFVDDLGADSLSTVELVIALEEAFDISIDDDNAEGIITVGDTIRYVTEAIGE